MNTCDWIILSFMLLNTVVFVVAVDSGKKTRSFILIVFLSLTWQISHLPKEIKQTCVVEHK